MTPFKDLKVVELASVLAGPTASLFFAELGADVIKIENKTTGGDVTRHWKTPGEKGNVSAYYSAANWNKKNIFYNLKEEAGQQKVLGLLKDADLLITNFKYGDDKKFGLDYHSLKFQFPKLIVGEIGGFAIDKSRVAYDVVLQAETGFMSINGTQQSGPIKIPIAMMDLLAAHQLKEGLLVALIEKGKTGKGCNVKVNLEEAGISSLANQASNYLMNGIVPKPMGSLHPNIAPYGDTFLCQNNKVIVLAVGSESQFKKLCALLGKRELATEEKFKTNQKRVENRTALGHALSPLFLGVNRNVFLASLHDNKVPAAAVKNLDEVLDGPVAQQMILTEDIENTDTKRVKTVAFTIHK